MTKRWIALLGFLLVTMGGGLAIGAWTAPGEWYAGLAKPPFNPPAWVFAPVWTVLYLMIAIAGWLTFQRDPRSVAMRLWWAQLALNFIWSPVFFAAHWIGAAVLVILLMLAAILGFILVSWHPNRGAAWLFVPYAAWVAFASVLNISIWLLN
jgi:tryptophan-rich sensory protein